MVAFQTDEQRWQAVVTREPQADGLFVYGVVTTGVYCRPACASRLPNRENVRFFATWREAEEAGLRACRRCNPQSAARPVPYAEAIAEACRTIASAEASPSLARLASTAGLSPSHFGRLFKRQVGVTPKRYAAELRMQRVRQALHDGQPVTDAIYRAGYGSSSRFYEDVDAKLGMSPSRYRQAGLGVRIRFAVRPCPLGFVLVATTDRGICAILLGDDPQTLEHELRAGFAQAELDDGDVELAAHVAQVLRYLDTPQEGLELPLDIQGTAFQRRVWQALRTLPVGATATYGELAAQIGQPQAARAVARVCATNPVALAIPCHRVIRRDGGLGGFRWGLERKRRLLERET
jgi:AraC family transcriptional regulator of adaptative response/methylated-DNA-[protein]-cysteine methyltransferase